MSTEQPSRPSIRYLLLAIIVAGILYGSLYPFFFHFSEAGSPLSHLLSTWRAPPQSRGDLLANILIYIPVGFAIGAAYAAGPRTKCDLAIVTAGVGILSVSVELLQYYDESRVSCLSDVYLNVAGALVGWFCFRFRIITLAAPSMPRGGAAVFARILLASWLGWRLFPYVPTIDLHKYWASLKPVFLAPSVNPFAVLRYSLIWLGVAFLVRLGIDPKRFSLSLFFIVAGYLAARIVIINQVIALPEIWGATLAMLLAPMVLGRKEGAKIRAIAAVFFVLVIAGRLSLWDSWGIARTFGWVPFSSFLHGSLEVNLVSFMEKFFLYGTLFLLLVRSGLSVGYAAAIESLTLLATSILATHMRGRSSEITDALLVVIQATIYLTLIRECGESNLVKSRSGSRDQKG